MCKIITIIDRSCDSNRKVCTLYLVTRKLEFRVGYGEEGLVELRYQ